MSTHTATIVWQRQDQVFTDRRYSRAHRWQFDGGQDVLASSSPHVVRLPFSDPAGIDPEEAFVAGLSSCHMLWLLDIAAGQGWRIDSYRDAAEGHMAKNADGRLWMAEVVLKPHLVFSGERRPDDVAVALLHEQAHHECYLANSVRSAVRVQGSWAWAGA
ncbi:OsmC family protein [Paucibacter sp. APW11]|uniref:OsmC family protein n=1 Tax=Roseateles aquae TaxID=3077235 RepID=A0ABU3PFX6_9BURK|nr:OsmC family protein [Paucibacter sp. APW11]MDT9000826.1 OsmC family protein [Paucibacter sp. APW11]